MYTSLSKFATITIHYHQYQLNTPQYYKLHAIPGFETRKEPNSSTSVSTESTSDWRLELAKVQTLYYQDLKTDLTHSTDRQTDQYGQVKHTHRPTYTNISDKRCDIHELRTCGYNLICRYVPIRLTPYGINRQTDQPVPSIKSPNTGD